MAQDNTKFSASQLSGFYGLPKTGISTPVRSEEKKAEGTKGLEGFATGFTKGLLSTSRNVASGLQKAGQAAIAAVDPTRTYQDVKSKTGIKSIDDTTHEGKGVKDILAARGTAEKIGQVVEQVGEFFVPASKVSKATAGASRLGKIGANVASDVAVTAAQEGDTENLGKVGVTSAILSSLPVVGKGVSKMVGSKAGKAATALEEKSLRLTPAQKLQVQKDDRGVIDYLTQKKITGSPEARYEKVVKMSDDFEDKVQDAIRQADKKYTKQEIIDSVKTIPDEFLQLVDSPQVYNQMQRDVDAFVDFVNRQKGDTIDASRINSFKRNYAKEARNKLGDTVINDSRAAISDGLYSILKRDVPTLKPLNEEYSKVIGAEKLLGKALGRNELGLIGNLIGAGAGGAVGGMVGGPVGGVVGATAGPAIGRKIAGTATRSRVGAGLQGLSEYLKNAPVNEAGDFVIPRSVIESLMTEGD